MIPIPRSPRHVAVLRFVTRSVSVLLTVSACTTTPAAFGPSPEIARARAEQLFTGLTERFTHVDRSPDAQASLAKVERAVFTPSRIVNDSSVWTVMRSDSVRLLSLSGHFVTDHYVVAQIARQHALDELAASSEEVRLSQTTKSTFEWSTVVEQVIGSETGDDLDRVLGTLLAGAASSSGETARAQASQTFPRSSAVLGALFSVDTLRSIPRPDGTAEVDVTIGIHPGTLAKKYPQFGRYLKSYLDPTRIQCTLRDARGMEWIDVDLHDARLTMRLRADRDGRFAPLDGPVHPMPDSLVATWDFHTKVWLFSLGMSDLASDMIIVHTPQTRGVLFRFRHEPRWHFPLAVDHLVKGSLRRPFADAGAHYGVTLTDSGRSVTLLQREGGVAVQEGTIMRWLGGLGARALGEFSGPTEAEESAYLAAVFAALGEDVSAALAAPR